MNGARKYAKFIQFMMTPIRICSVREVQLRLQIVGGLRSYYISECTTLGIVSEVVVSFPLQFDALIKHGSINSTMHISDNNWMNYFDQHSDNLIRQSTEIFIEYIF